MVSLSIAYKIFSRKKITVKTGSSSEFGTNVVTLYAIRLATLPTGTAHQGGFSIFKGGKDEIF